MTRQEMEFLRDKYFVEETSNVISYIEEIISNNKDIFCREFEHVFKHYEQNNLEITEKVIKGNVIANLFQLTKMISEKSVDECSKSAKNVYKVPKNART